MMKSPFYNSIIVISFLLSSCYLSEAQGPELSLQLKTESKIRCGADRTDLYFPLIQGKKIALVANHSSSIGNTHLADSLVGSGMLVEHIYAPEHGFRGEEEAGAHIKDGVDQKSGLQLYSLHGDQKKPSVASLSGIEFVLFDIQDVGARFYTYISTLHYVMQACAEQNIPLLILDRPNPNGFYVDGPVLDMAFKSFVGMHPVPIVHGMSMAEYANMLNQEGWLGAGLKCDLRWVLCDRWDHLSAYECPIPPSPNLPNNAAIYLYPSLCLFEGTVVSVGRGTDRPFQVIGYPKHPVGSLQFTPKSMKSSLNPPHEGKLCRGHDLKDFGSFYFTSSGELYVDWLIGMYEVAPDKGGFFSSVDFFDKLAGGKELREQIIKGWDAEKIRASWQPKLDEYRLLRKKYVLYPDFD